MQAVQNVLKGQQKSSQEKQEIASADQEVHLVKFQEHHKNTHVQGGTQAQHHDSEEEEDDNMHGGQRVGCQQQ